MVHCDGVDAFALRVVRESAFADARQLRYASLVLCRRSSKGLLQQMATQLSTTLVRSTGPLK